MEVVQNIIKETNSIEYTLNKAQQEVALAKKHLARMPDNQFTRALYQLAELAVERRF